LSGLLAMEDTVSRMIATSSEGFVLRRAKTGRHESQSMMWMIPAVVCKARRPGLAGKWEGKSVTGSIAVSRVAGDRAHTKDYRSFLSPVVITV
jgi:hypothetical protein